MFIAIRYLSLNSVDPLQGWMWILESCITMRSWAESRMRECVKSAGMLKSSSIFSFHLISFFLSWSFRLFSQHTNKETIEQTQENCELNFPYNNVILPSRDSSPHMWVISRKFHSSWSTEAQTGEWKFLFVQSIHHSAAVMRSSE